MNINNDVSSYQLKIVFITLYLRNNSTHFEGYMPIYTYVISFVKTKKLLHI